MTDHDPMLDGITRFNAHGEWSVTGGYVLFSDLPAFIARVREDERRTLPPTERHREWWIAFGMGKVQGQRDERERMQQEYEDRVMAHFFDGMARERERIRTGVTGLPDTGASRVSVALNEVLAVIDGDA